MRTVLLYHPDLDRTVEVRPAQARVLAGSGWQRVGEPPPHTPNPSDDAADADDITADDTTEE